MSCTPRLSGIPTSHLVRAQSKIATCSEGRQRRTLARTPRRRTRDSRYLITYVIKTPPCSGTLDRRRFSCAPLTWLALPSRFGLHLPPPAFIYVGLYFYPVHLGVFCGGFAVFFYGFTDSKKTLGVHTSLIRESVAFPLQPRCGRSGPIRCCGHAEIRFAPWQWAGAACGP